LARRDLDFNKEGAVRPHRVLFLTIWMVLAAASTVQAQGASIIGTVTDETKAVLPGVTVTATDVASGEQFTVTTNEKGEYRLRTVPPGAYTLRAELPGFSALVLERVELLVGQHATIPFTLKLARVSETVTVAGETPLVDTSSSQIGGNVDRRQMEELPLQGRNWMELSKLVKGITANDVTNTPGVSRDDDFQLNLDGQQITQKIAGSGFGQPRFSRESIAEFQIVTNMFDITQGRSTGIEVQAITRSGTNRTSGSVYGFFRDDKFNAPDPVANKVLPYSNQQVGGSLGGPVVKDKLHYFASYEYEREPGTYFSSPSALPGESFTIPYKNNQKSVLARIDDQLSTTDRLTLRGSRWDWSNPFVLGVGAHPSNASVQTKDATNVVGIWNKVVSDTKVQEVRIGYNNFDWTNKPQPGLANTIDHRKALQLSAVVPSEQLRVTLRPRLAPRHPRLQDRRRVPVREEHRHLVHPTGRPDDLHVGSAGHRAADSGERLGQSGGVEPRGTRPLRPALRSELPPRRLGHQRPAADMGGLDRRQLARQQSPDDQLRRSLGRRLGRGVAA
jgi:hypothetical protein